MSYQNYVIAAYAVFAIVLAWDFVSSRLQIRRELRAARQRAARQAGQAGARKPTGELSR
ncbi:heme exporter protein CcmD [Lysobacter silvisoli]|uniref:Heme exporter protein D n=1 Tax=Lysobacter silvisoli TaxID=2293254 RepID=A0A371K499_9GAMM|nr:heme exporter protein CcmD [Lysobacter silvisoli]RDZ28753.1 heme exporter protein CcmD [Lysobacter silvisoli]